MTSKTPKAAWMERARAARALAGMCVQCGQRPPAGESECCRACLDADRARYARKVGAIRRVLRCHGCGAQGHFAKTCGQSNAHA